MKGTISISRTHGGEDSASIRLTIKDGLSHARFLEATMTPEVFALALTGLAEQEIEFDLRPTLVGKRREHKTELVPHSDTQFTLQGEKGFVQKALAPFEIDGWQGSREDFLNGYKREGKFQRVSFVRYVDPE